MKCYASEEGEDLVKEHSLFASVVGSLDMLERREFCLADAYL